MDARETVSVESTDPALGAKVAQDLQSRTPPWQCSNQEPGICPPIRFHIDHQFEVAEGFL